MSINETFVWAVSEGAVLQTLCCDFKFYVTKPMTEHTWYTKEEFKHYKSLIIGDPIATINWTGKTRGMTEASEMCTKIYATSLKTVFVSLDVYKGDERVSGICKEGFSVNRFTKKMKRLHEREQWCLENKREHYEKYL